MIRESVKMSAFFRKNSPFLPHRARARIVPDHYISSGSDHSAEADDESLSDLFYGFQVDDAIPQSSLEEDEPDSVRERSACDLEDALEELSKHIVLCNMDSFRNVLFDHVIKAIEIFSFVKSNAPMFRRNVMSYLRNLGYNAAICKTKWEQSGGLTAGNYEFVDVVRCDSGNRIFCRYFVDLDFAPQFEIARPTPQYERLLQSLPNTFVGKTEELKQVLKAMSSAAKRSLKSKDLHLPPWRKHRYMQNMWFGSYKRTTNLLFSHSSVLPQPPPKQNLAVKCRSIGFDTTAVDGRLLYQATARTR